MKIIKYEHACLDIREGDDRLIIDPGIYSSSLTDVTNVTALVITHVHTDHYDEEKIKQILMQNPTLQIFTTDEVKKKLNGGTVTVPELTKIYQAGNFRLEFFGGQHAMITQTYPINQNVGVLVNDTLYYPGDSLTPCPKPHTVLAVPTMAPWLKISEAIDLITADTAQKVIPSHDGFLNDAGHDMHTRLLSQAAEASHKTYYPLKPTESLEV
jgi:L-ascorbate metabolism protein UlaG (beta-lactamase superfamily)